MSESSKPDLERLAALVEQVTHDLAEPHHGDCTHEPQPCLRCFAEDKIDDPAWTALPWLLAQAREAARLERELDALVPLRYDDEARVYVSKIPEAPMSQGLTKESARKAGLSALVLALRAYADVRAELSARLAACERERKCWEPGHVYRDAPPDDAVEHRHTRVHCVMCTDAAMENARRPLTAERDALQASLDQLHGARFSDRAYHALKSRAETAEREREDLEAVVLSGTAAICRQIALTEQIAQERDALRAALAQYGDHTDDCAYKILQHPCTCGLDAIRAGTRP